MATKKGTVIERRKAICPLHQGLEDKIVLVLKNQSAYMEQHSEMTKDVTYIKTTIDNGLKTKVSEAHDCIKDLKEKMAIIDDFQWFREMVNKLRDNLFRSVCKFAFYGGIVIFVGSAVFVVGQKVWTIIMKLV